MNPKIQIKSRPLKASELLNVYHALRKHFGHQRWWPGETPFEAMIGAILTQNTAWTNVEKAIRQMKKAKALTPHSLDALSEKKIATLIKPSGYFNVKAKRLKNFVRFLNQEFRGKIRLMKKQSAGELRAKLLQVNGIGPETADSILLYALSKPTFVMDAYTKRIFSRHKLLSPEKNLPMNLTHTYDEWKKVFEGSLPKNASLYNDFHAQVVALGKNYCKTRPNCSRCPLHKFL